MLADPSRRSLMSRPARRVCCAAKPYGTHAAVRSCALLATDSRDVTLSCRSAYLRTARGRYHAVSTQYSLTKCNHCNRCLRGWSRASHSDNLCICYTFPRLSCGTDCRMIASYQSLTLRDVPFRLYGSLRAVKVVFPCCPEPPPLTVLAPPVGPASTASRWSTSRPSTLWRPFAMGA